MRKFRIWDIYSLKAAWNQEETGKQLAMMATWAGNISRWRASATLMLRSFKACSAHCRQGMPWQWCSSRSPMSWSGEASCHGLNGQVKLTPRTGSGRSQVRVSLMILATLDMGMGMRAPIVFQKWPDLVATPVKKRHVHVPRGRLLIRYTYVLRS